MIPFIKYSKIWLVLSLLVAVVSVVFLFMWGLKPGIDFTGGSLWEISFSKERPSDQAIREIFEKNEIKDAVYQKAGDYSYIVRMKFLSEEVHQDMLKTVREKFQTNGNTVREERFETIGSSVSKQLRQRSSQAILLVLLGIIGYIAYAFRQVSRPVASWKYGLLAIIALVHDVLLVMGVFAVLGKFRGVEVDLPFIVAILTVLGYSVNDTIVVFDRVRENLLRRTSNDFAETVNNGLNETLMRSINTTLKTTLPLFALYFLGGSTIHSFVLALIIGIISGAYSSIFIATPLLVWVEKMQRKNA
jgi:preprotein translocase subunit SecF